VLRLLAELGTGFDCASKAEIELVLKFDVDPSRIIYAQPCKTKSYIRYAAQQGVKQMTFDNADELYKIKQFCPDAKLLLRILTDDSASLCRLSLKFGACLTSTQGLLELAKQLDLNIVGDLKTLDIGGGFVGETFEEMAGVLSRALDDHFPSHIRIIGEPGRYYVSSAFTIACNVIARRTVEIPELQTKSYMLYLNDGVYGNFSSIMFDHQHPVPQILKSGDNVLDDFHSYKHDMEHALEYSIWGPTCDGIDCISSSTSRTWERTRSALRLGSMALRTNMRSSIFRASLERRRC